MLGFFVRKRRFFSGGVCENRVIRNLKIMVLGSEGLLFSRDNLGVAPTPLDLGSSKIDRLRPRALELLEKTGGFGHRVGRSTLVFQADLVILGDIRAF